MDSPGLVVWFCGLPGSGKSTVAKMFLEAMETQYGLDFEYISMDGIRKKIFPEPKYDDSERDAAYRALVLVASFLSRNGKSVILDGTGHKLVWRNFARKECEKFVEVYLKCPVEICIGRETIRVGLDGVRKKLYQDALLRLRTGETFVGLGKVPGVDEPFEESAKPEVQVDASKQSEAVLDEVIRKLRMVSPRIFNKHT